MEEVLYTGEGLLAQLEKFEIWGAYKDFNLEKVIQYILNGYRNNKS